MKRPVEKDLPVMRPATLGEARKLIEETFRFNKWNRRDREVYFSLLGLSFSEKIDSESVRVILEDMEKSKMILFMKDKNKGEKQ